MQDPPRPQELTHPSSPNPETSAFRRLALGCALIALPMLLAPVGILGGVGVALGSASIFCAWRTLRRVGEGRSRAADAFVAVLLVMALVGAAVALVPDYAINRLLSLFAGVVAYYAVLVYAQGERGVARVAAALGLGVGAIGLAALLSADWQRAPIFEPTFALYGRIPSFIAPALSTGIPRVSELFSPRQIGGVLSFLLPIGVVAASLAQRRWLKVALLGCAALGFGVLALTQTVLAWAALAVGTAAMWLVMQPGGAALRLAAGVAVLVVAVGLLVWLVPGARAEIGVTLEREADAQARAVAHLDMLRLAALVIADTPFTGAGLNNFPVIVTCFYPHPPERDISYYPHAHNVLAQAAVDFGWLGAMAVAGLAVGGLLDAGLAARRGRSDRVRRLAAGVFAGLVAWLAFGVFEAIIVGAKAMPVVWALLGLARAISPPEEPSSRARFDRWLVIGFGVVVCALVIAGVLSGALQHNLELLACRLGGACSTLASDCPIATR